MLEITEKEIYIANEPLCSIWQLYGKYECCLFCLLIMMVLKCSIPQVIVGAELRVSA